MRKNKSANPEEYVAFLRRIFKEKYAIKGSEEKKILKYVSLGMSLDGAVEIVRLKKEDRGVLLKEMAL